MRTFSPGVFPPGFLSFNGKGRQSTQVIYSFTIGTAHGPAIRAYPYQSYRERAYMDRTGIHLIIDLYGLGEDLLKDGPKIMERLEIVLQSIDATIVKKSFFSFENKGEGVTGYFILSESHLSFHSYPESNFIALDVFFCKPFDSNNTIKIVDSIFDPDKIESHHIKRGNKN